MSPDSSVLIVDPSDETREVLKTVLERHGVRAATAARAVQGLRLARRTHPAIIVLSLEEADRGNAAVSDGFADHAAEQKASLVVIGSARIAAEAFPRAEFISAPYHYGPLIRRIEELLRTNTARDFEAGTEPVRHRAA